MVVVHFIELGMHVALSKVSNHTFTRLEASSCVRPARSVGVRVTQHGENTTTSSGVAVTVAVRARRKSITFPSLPRPPPPPCVVSTRLTAYLAAQGRGDHTRNEARCLSLTRRAPTAQPRCRKQLTRYGQPEAGILWRWGSLLGATLADPWWALFST